jgi:hypothetical protein
MKRLVKRFPTFPSFAGRDAKSGQPLFLPVPLYAQQQTDDRIPTFLLEDLLMLARNGSLLRVRRCALPSCQRFFYAKRGDHEYCSRNCRRKRTRETQKFKKKNQQYQRRHYRKFSGKHQIEWRRFYEGNAYSPRDERKRQYHGPATQQPGGRY